MDLFRNQDTSSYFNNQKNILKTEIQNLSDEQILNTKMEELIEYFYNSFYINPIILYMDKITTNIEKSKKEQYNPFYGMGSPFNESKTFIVDSYKINYNIPFDGNCDLLYNRPSHCILSTFPIDGFKNEYSKEYMPSILFSINIDCQTLDQQEDPKNYINSLFNKEFNSYQSMIQYLNNDISSFNNQLKNNISQLLNERKNKANKFSSLVQKLNIPLKENQNAANIEPIPLQTHRERKSFPKATESEKIWCISNDDYSNIKKIISQACISFEKTPTACQKLNEEELRDMLLANLNTHYNSLATGETFSKKGKTDIRIQFENKSAYIAECKIWHGISEFKKAITQLFSYTTWRDIKTSLIIFNKEIKDFSSIIDKIKAELSTNTLKVTVSEISKNEWQCTFKKSLDSQELIQLHVIVCDINI